MFIRYRGRIFELEMVESQVKGTTVFGIARDTDSIRPRHNFKITLSHELDEIGIEDLIHSLFIPDKNNDLYDVNYYDLDSHWARENDVKFSIKKSVGRPHESTGKWFLRAEAAGGKVKLAKELGVSLRSVNRYEREEMEMSKPVQMLLDAFDKKHGIRPTDPA